MGVGRSVRAYGPTGQLWVEISLEGRLQALALSAGLERESAGDGPGGPAPATEALLWAATGEPEGEFTPFAITGYDLATGEALRRLELAEGDEVSALTVDPASGALWVAFSDRLARYDAEATLVGETFFEEGEVPVSHLSPDGFGGLWAVRPGQAPVEPGSREAPAPPRLLRFDGEGMELLSLTPFGEATEVRRLALEPATRTLWVATAMGLQRVSAAGYSLAALDLGPQADLRDLALGESPADTEAPALTITAPGAGATLETARPEIHLSWADTGAGVDPQSLAFEASGFPLAVRCDTSFEGAVCTPLEALPEGQIILSATVADFSANLSPRASVTFTVETEATDDPDDPDSGADPVPFHSIAIQRGLEANKVYLTDNDVEAINTSTGNLTLSIPIGQAYSVGPLISYQIRANYNSNIWQRAIVDCAAADVDCSPGSVDLEVMVPNPAANAGLGWEVHFGRLYSPVLPTGLSGLERALWPNGPDQQADPSAGWLYVAPDGSHHPFYRLTERPAGAEYTKDGSHLRLREVNGNRTEVHHPNGVISVFEKTADFEGTLFCGGGVSGCWRFLEQRDPYGNKFSLSYSSTGSVETWTVTDSVSTSSERRHELKFSLANSDRRGGDGRPSSSYTRANGDEWGDLRRVLQTVKLDSFGGADAVWRFHRRNATVPRGCTLEGAGAPGEPTSLKTALLWKIDPPLLLPYVFETFSGNGGQGCSTLSGKITEMTLPSRGKVAYRWNSWNFPTLCTYRGEEPTPGPRLRYRQIGIAAKSRHSPSGALEGTWTYRNSLIADGPVIPWGPTCDREDYRKTTVDGPVVDSHYTREVFYAAVTEGPQFPNGGDSIDTWQVTDNGLPLTKSASIGASPATRRFLSRETYRCKVGEECGASHKRRSVYVRYASEWKPSGPCLKLVGNPPSCWGGNATLVAERTVFHQDNDRYVERRFTDQTGLGFARRVVTVDNFNAGPLREVRLERDYEKGHPGLAVGSTGYFVTSTLRPHIPVVGAAWILHPSKSERRTEGGRSYQMDTVYNPAGYLTCTGGGRGRAWVRKTW